MSTPATAALSDAGSGAAGAGGAPPAAGAGAAAAPPPASNDKAFWGSWNLPDQKETREWVANKNYDSPFTLAKTAQALEREAATLRAGKGYPVDKPGADGKPARDENAWKAWNALTGVPETPDKYEVPVRANDPFPQFQPLVKEALHKAGVPAAMAAPLATAYNEAMDKLEHDIRAKEDTQSKLELAEIQHAWGANYQERMALAARGKTWLYQQAFGTATPTETQERMLELSLGGTSKFMNIMWQFGAGNREAAFAGSDGGGAFNGGPSEAQARLDQITRDRSSGKISDFEWRDRYEKEVLLLRDRIVGGMSAGNA